jgi:hypothetical protein
MTNRRKSTLTNPPGLAPGGSFIELGHIVFGRAIQAGVDNLLHRLASWSASKVSINRVD